MTPLVSDALVIDLSPDAGPGALVPVLSGAGLLVHLVRPLRGDRIPADLRRMEGLVVIGEAGGAPPRTPEQERALEEARVEIRALLRTALARHLPTLSIGEGALLAAHALEGRIGPSPAVGAETSGLAPLLLSDAGADDLLLRALAPADGADVPVLRLPGAEAVLALPPSSRLLAHDAAGEIAAYRIEGSLWGLLFHPEAVEDGIGRRLPAGQALPAPGSPARAAWTALLAAFAAVLRED